MKITQETIIGNIASKMGRTKADVKAFWDVAHAEILQQLRSGHEATTPIGVISTVTKPSMPIERRSFGRTVTVMPKTTVKYRLSKVAVAHLNGSEK